MIDVIRERKARTFPGLLALFVLFAMGAAGFVTSTVGAALLHGSALAPLAALTGMGVMFLTVFSLKGLFMVHPNRARVFQLFGKYVGTVRTPGLHFTNPLYAKSTLSVRVRNFESEVVKVNDSEGNPVEIGAIVVWRVDDTAEALFHVDNYQHFVAVQSEAALRSLATLYPYDATHADMVSLRSHPAKVAERLAAEIRARLAEVGVEVIEARISHLAYAPEIAGAMLQRQQANAIVAARETIVEGAVGMVDMALESLASRQIVDLDQDSRAQLVANLLVVLCSDSNAQPVVQTGAAPRRRAERLPASVAA